MMNIRINMASLLEAYDKARKIYKFEDSKTSFIIFTDVDETRKVSFKTFDRGVMGNIFVEIEFEEGVE